MGKYIKNLEEKTQSVLRESLTDDVAKFLNIEPKEAENIVSSLQFSDYLELANAVDLDDREAAMDLLDYAEPVEEDEMDSRGKMCPVCSGGRREGYGNDCPNCDGEGYLEEIAPVVGMAARAAGAAIGSRVADKVMGEEEIDEAPEPGQQLEIGSMVTSSRGEQGEVVEFMKRSYLGMRAARVKVYGSGGEPSYFYIPVDDENKVHPLKENEVMIDEGFFDMFKQSNTDEEVAQWAAAVMREYGRHTAAQHIIDMKEKGEWIRQSLGRYVLKNPKGEFAPEVSWVMKGYDTQLNESDVKLLDKPTMSLGEIAEKHGVALADLGVQLTKGIKVELEHTDDRKVAKEIALDHLMELPDYYDRLEQVEEEGAGVGGGAAAVGGEAAGVGTGKQPSKTGYEGAGKGIYEAKAGSFKSPVIGQRVKLVHSEDAWDKPVEPGTEGTVTRAERVHTFSRLRPFIIVYTVETDDGQKIDIRREGVRKVKAVEEADNPFITPPSEAGTIAGDDAPLGRKSIDDLATGDDIEVIDIDGEPTAVTVKNAKAPGDTIIVQTDTGEEHIVKKQAVSGTPQMEELQNMYEAAMEEGKWDYPDEMKGKEKPYADNYTPSGAKNRKKRKAFRKAQKAKAHAARMRGELVDEEADGEMKGLFIPVSAKSKNTRTYLPRSIRAILKDNGIKITGRTRVSTASDSILSDGVVVRISGLKFPQQGRDLNVAKDIYDRLRFAGYNVEDYPTFVSGGVNVFVSNENPDGRTAMKMDEAADKIKPINKMGYAPKAGSWKRRMHKAQPPENHEKTKKRHKKLREEDPEGAEERKAFKQKLKDPAQYYIRREYHIGKKQFDDFPAVVLDTAEGDHWTGMKYKVRFADNKGEEYTNWYSEKGGLSGRFYDERLIKAGEKAKYVGGDSRNEWPPAGTPLEEARNASNTEHSGAKKGKGGYYGRKKDAKSDSNKKRRANDKKAVDENFDPATHVNVEHRDPEGKFIVVHAPPAGYWAIGKGKHSQDIDRVSFDHLDDAIEHAELCLSSLDEEFRNTIFDKVGDHVGTPLGNGVVVDIQPMDDRGHQIVKVKLDKYKDHDGDTFKFDVGDLMPAKGDETLSRVRQLAGIKETASGGATGAGAVASAPAAVGDMHSRDPSIYGKTTKKPKRKKRTKENKSDGLGRSRKE